MASVKIHYYVAATLDGFIARRDGSVDFLEAFEDPACDYGYAEFIASIGTVVMGRKTYEDALRLGKGGWTTRIPAALAPAVSGARGHPRGPHASPCGRSWTVAFMTYMHASQAFNTLSTCGVALAAGPPPAVSLHGASFDVPPAPCGPPGVWPYGGKHAVVFTRDAARAAAGSPHAELTTASPLEVVRALRRGEEQGAGGGAGRLGQVIAEHHSSFWQLACLC